MMRHAAVRLALIAVTWLCIVGTGDLGAQKRPLPPLPGQEDPIPAPLPGSTFVGENPLNAGCIDAGPLMEGLLARGAGVGAGFERAVGTMVAVAAYGGWIRVTDPAAEYVLDLASALTGLRLYLLNTAVTGPAWSIVGGVAVVWLRGNAQSLRFVWPQIQTDVAVKFSLGTQARGLFVEPFAGYKLVFKGAQSTGVPIPRYGGFQFGLRVGFSF